MNQHAPPGGPNATNVRMLPCSCYAWRLGGADGVQRCVPHAWEHHWQHDERWDGTCGCLCITCRADRHGLSPWEYVEEKIDEDRSARAYPPTVPDSGDDMAVLLCGCCALRAGGAWHIATACGLHSRLFTNRAIGDASTLALVRAIMEEQRRVAAGGPLGLVLEPEPPPVPEVPRGPSMTATLAAGPASPPQRPSWWRRILARLRRTS